MKKDVYEPRQYGGDGTQRAQTRQTLRLTLVSAPVVLV